MTKIFDKGAQMLASYWPQTALLHDHLDGSNTLVPILPKLFELSGKRYPFDSRLDVQADMAKLFRNPQVDIVKKFSNTTGVMQNPHTIFLAAENYVKVRASQGFKYCEATIAPQYHVFGDEVCVAGTLSEKDVVDCLIAGIKSGEKLFPEIEVNLIGAVDREVSSENAVKLVEIFAKCDCRYMPAIGLVCDEAAHPPEKHKAMFRRAKELGFKTTCHAGEWCHLLHEKPNALKDAGFLLRNIRTAVYDLQVDRIGHAIPLAYDECLTKTVLDRKIGVEGCPGSNFSSGLIPNTAYLKIRELLQAGVLYSLNPDDDLFMPNLSEVFQICNAEYHFTEEEIQKLLRNPWLSRFGRRKEHKF